MSKEKKEEKKQEDVSWVPCGFCDGTGFDGAGRTCGGCGGAGGRFRANGQKRPDW